MCFFNVIFLKSGAKVGIFDGIVNWHKLYKYHTITYLRCVFYTMENCKSIKLKNQTSNWGVCLLPEAPGYMIYLFTAYLDKL